MTARQPDDPTAPAGGQARRIRRLQVALILVGCTCVLMAGSILQLSLRSVRTVLVPPQIRTEAWIEDEHMSPSFHVQWGTYLASLALSATPSSVEYQARQLLRHVSPAIGGRFAAELDVNAARLREMQASTFFSVARAHVRPERGQVALVGRLATFVRDRRVSERPRSYVMQFDVANGRPLLKSFRQTTHSDPFGDNESAKPFASGGPR